MTLIGFFRQQHGRLVSNKFKQVNLQQLGLTAIHLRSMSNFSLSPSCTSDNNAFKRGRMNHERLHLISELCVGLLCTFPNILTKGQTVKPQINTKLFLLQKQAKLEPLELHHTGPKRSNFFIRWIGPNGTKIKAEMGPKRGINDNNDLSRILYFGPVCRDKLMPPKS